MSSCVKIALCSLFTKRVTNAILEELKFLILKCPMTINPSVLLNTNLPLPLFIRGKVRDTYDLGNQLLIIATDGISAFDFVLPCGIPDKGLVLNQLSVFWFRRIKNLVPNH